MKRGVSIGESIRIQNALMAELITACLGDKAKAIRLLEFERRRNPRLKTTDAIDLALERLCRDRGGIGHPASISANVNPDSAWTNAVPFTSGTTGVRGSGGIYQDGVLLAKPPGSTAGTTGSPGPASSGFAAESKS
jgi:hypothetical protein